MKRLAIVLILAGVGMMAFSLFMNVAVNAPDMTYADPLLRSGVVANIDLIGQREVLAQVGTALFIGGWIAFAVQALRPVSPPPAA